MDKLGIMIYLSIQINLRENRWGHQNWTTHRNWKYSAYKTRDEDKQNNNTTQYE